jgi:hypothetical protein
MMSQQIWLSRGGKAEGPFDQAAIDKLKASGEIRNYVWIWTPESKGWNPIQLAPPPPPPGPQAAATAAVPPSTASLKAIHPVPAVRSAVSPLAAICHDNRSVVAGVLGAKHGEVWILSSKDRLTEIPPFQRGAKVWINLLDEQSGQSENAQATLVDYKKTSESWEYSLKWQTETPRLVHGGKN